MNILVSGGAGFIGSHVVERLLNHGYRIKVLDNLSTGKRSNLPATHPALVFVEGDISDLETVDCYVRETDTIIHLAAIASVQASVRDPLTTHQTNLVGVLHLLEAARRHRARRFVIASSAAVYGDAKSLPISEDAALNPMSPYAIDKLAGEHYVQHYSRQYGLAGLCLRFFNVYGPRQDPTSPYSGVLSRFIEHVLARKPITIFGDGRQSRDFVYVADLVSVVLKALTAPIVATPVLNIGTGRGLPP